MQRRSTRRKSSRVPPACVSHAAPDIYSDSKPCLNMLPDELLLKVGSVIGDTCLSRWPPCCMAACT